MKIGHNFTINKIQANQKCDGIKTATVKDTFVKSSLSFQHIKLAHTSQDLLKTIPSMHPESVTTHLTHKNADVRKASLRKLNELPVLKAEQTRAVCDIAGNTEEDLNLRLLALKVLESSKLEHSKITLDNLKKDDSSEIRMAAVRTEVQIKINNEVDEQFWTKLKDFVDTINKNKGNTDEN